MSRNTIYWICQIAGWSAYTIFMIILTQFQYAEGESGFIGLNVILGGSFLLTTHVLRMVYKRNSWSSFGILRLFGRLFVSNIAASVVCQAFITTLLYVVFKPNGIGEFSWKMTLFYIININIILWLWSIIYFVIHYFDRFKKSELKRTKIALALKDAELQMLKKQLNPHFTFNALNNIRTLILEDANKAREAITSLSDLMRYSLQGNKNDFVLLQQEMEIVKDYVRLQEIQFEERLEVSINVDEDLNEVNVPPFCIQLLVENAVKHGIVKQVSGGVISINVSKADEKMAITVVNSGNLDSNAVGTKTGLQNLRQRLEMLYKSSSGPTLKQISDNKVKVELMIPLEV